MPNENAVILEDVRLIFRNFEGKEGQYNRAGDRNFGVILDDNQANELERSGWNVKYLKAREEDDVPQPWIQVSVSYKNRPPLIVMITSRGRSELHEDQIEIMDWVDVAHVDLYLNPYSWAVSGKTGIKAYLKSAYITIDEDPLQLKYADVPEASVYEIEETPATLQLTATRED